MYILENFFVLEQISFLRVANIKTGGLPSKPRGKLFQHGLLQKIVTPGG